VGREHHTGADGVDEARGGDPDGPDRAIARGAAYGLDEGVLDGLGRDHATRRDPPDQRPVAAVAGDRRGQDLAASDVDADDDRVGVTVSVGRGRRHR
jgi:hypothetical protein